MFDQQLFDKTKFIKEKISYEFTLPNLTNSTQFINIGLNINADFFMQMGVAITSIFENNKDKSFNIHIFVDAYKKEDLNRVRETAKKYSQNLYVYLIDMKPFEGFHLKMNRFSRVTYLRLIMPKVLKDIADKFIYMDADMICLGNINELFNINLQGKPLAAVSDSPGAVEYRTKFLKMKNGKYFNDGIMLIDINEWEKERITEKAFSYQGADPNKFLGQSQDIINMVVDGNAVFLEHRFNQYAGDNLPNNTIICHFLGRDKPWDMVLYDADKLWRHYLELSFWDNIYDPMPPKTPEHYHNFKRMAEVFRLKGNYTKMFISYFWYSILKIRLKLGL